MNDNTIRIRRTSTCWLATFTGPMFEHLEMNGKTVPTPYTAQCAAQRVVDALYARNPGARIVVDLGVITSNAEGLYIDE